jgi:hypothetical protein
VVISSTVERSRIRGFATDDSRPPGTVHIAVVPRYFGRIGTARWRGISSAQSEFVRSAALIAMPDSIGSTTRTIQRRGISQPPSEPALLSLEKNLITLSADCHSDIHRSLPRARHSFVKSFYIRKRQLCLKGL